MTEIAGQFQNLSEMTERPTLFVKTAITTSSKIPGFPRDEQGFHRQGKVREKCKKFKVREKSGNFEISQGNLKKYHK